MPEIFHSKSPHPKAQIKPEKKLEKHPQAGGMLSAFMVRPNGIHFETQEAKEDILLLMRRHMITNIGWALLTLLLLFVPPLFFPLLISSQPIPAGLPLGYFLVLPLVWYLGTFGFAFTNFLKWYYNVYIVTNERVVDIDWISLLYKELSSTRLDKIQDVTYKQAGILDSFFDFGTVLIQTAGTEPNFEFDAVPKPERVVRQINEILEEEKSPK